VTRQPRAFAAIDRGTATVAVSLVAQVAGRWRLLGSGAAPSAVPAQAVVERIRGRLAAIDPVLAAHLGLRLAGSGRDLRRVECSTSRPSEMAVVAATDRVLAPLVAAAATAGWRVRPIVLDGAEILPIASTLADARVAVVLAGASDPPGADERSLLPELGSIVAAATERRPGLVTVLAGGLAEPGGRIEALFAPDRPGATLLAPSPAVGDGEPLRELLDGLRGGEHDGWRAIAIATATLAEVLARRVEVIQIGQSAGVRATAEWVLGRSSTARTAVVPAAALLPPAFTDAHLDAVMGWLAVPLDRLRVRDRLRDLSLAPWSDAAGDGALLRLAAARAAVIRLLEATTAMGSLPAPDLVIASGGAWSVAPGPAVALALADVVRRPGIRAIGWDHSRLLGPLGSLDDAEERGRIVGDLRDELIVPLGTVVMPGGLRSGRSAGRLSVRGTGGAGEAAELDLVPGGIELVDLPPGERAIVELQLRDAVDLGIRTRRAAAEVTGGLAGLIVDMRDVPLRLPDRQERRRDLLAAWQAALWPGAVE
jgi:hypothetical protein